MTEPSSTPPEAAPAVAIEAAPDAAAAAPHVNVTALFAEGASKSGLVWVEVPDDRTWPAWHVVHEGSLLVVSGPGEQHLPWLPPEVRVILRSKDSGGRLLVVRGQVRQLSPGTPEWDTAVEALRTNRLNAPAGVEERWAREATIRVITPFGSALEAPGSMGEADGRVLVHPSSATTAGWRPWHLRGRPQRRRRQRPPA